MFIATADSTTLAPEERNLTHTIVFRSYGACRSYVGPIVYKHFVPTGTKAAFLRMTRHAHPIRYYSESGSYIRPRR